MRERTTLVHGYVEAAQIPGHTFPNSPARREGWSGCGDVPADERSPRNSGSVRDAGTIGSGGERERAMTAEPPDRADRNPDFDAIVLEYQKKIFNAIYRFIGDYEEATDLTQETFISAFKHYDRFRGDSKVFTWLYQIARNLCINRVRQRERQRALRIESLDQPRDLDDDEGVTREIADSSQAPHTVLEKKELQQRLRAAVEALPPDYREVVLLREYHNLSYNEIVEATGLTLENVKTRLSRARAMLRRKLEPYYRM
jgi:RNA polymerase sigma-70 factor (ECF subfamily)